MAWEKNKITGLEISRNEFCFLVRLHNYAIGERWLEISILNSFGSFFSSSFNCPSAKKVRYDAAEIYQS